MRPHVIRVAVVPPLVVGDDHLRPLGADDRYHPCDGFVERGLMKAGGIVIVGGASHARIAITELDQPLDAQQPHGRIQFPCAHLDQVLWRCQSRVADLAHRAVGTRHQHRAHAFGAIPRQDPTGADAFVIRVGVNGDKRALLWHGSGY